MHTIVVNGTPETLIAMSQTLCQNYSRQELYQRSLPVVAIASVQAGYVETIAGQSQSRDRKYLSIGFVFRIPETLVVFRCW